MQPPEINRSYDHAAPHAAPLIESLRAFGYTPEAAIADLIDNSISAGARNVRVTFFGMGRLHGSPSKMTATVWRKPNWWKPCGPEAATRWMPGTHATLGDSGSD